jgi:putative FmdB family regulatory protein
LPTYGYHCPHCETEFEVFQRMTDDAEADCPQCGAPGRRLFFPAGIVFKGSGFYKTDSRRASTASVNGSGTAKSGKATTDGKSSGGEKTSGGDATSGSKDTATGGATPSEASKAG